VPRCSPSYHLAFSLALAFLATTTVSFAQVKSSTINVVVTDSTGARVPDVQAEVVEEATNQKFTGATNNVGELTVPYLPAGRYTVSIRKEGFRPYIQTGLQLGLVEIVDVPRLLVLRALVGLLAFDLLGLGRNFSEMHRFVSRWNTSRTTSSEDIVNRVCAAINYACVWYPKRVLCVQRSVVTTCLLRTCGVPARMVMGAQSMPFKAHAWVEVEGRVVNDKPYMAEMFAVLDRC